MSVCPRPQLTTAINSDSVGKKSASRTLNLVLRNHKKAIFPVSYNGRVQKKGAMCICMKAAI